MQDKDGSESIDDCLAGLPDWPDDEEPADEFPADESSGIYHPEPYQSLEDLLARIEEDIQLAGDQPTQPRPRRTIKPTLKVRENAAAVMYAALNAATANPLDAAITDPTFQ